VTLALGTTRSAAIDASSAASTASESNSDAALVANMARGDRAALAVLYERHAPRLCALARQILGEPGEAEDLLHDVFLEVWRHAADYSEARGSVWSWLSLRTRSRAIDRRRSAPRARTIGLADSHLEMLSAVPDSSRDPLRLSERGRLRKALSTMSEPEREVLFLGYFQGLSCSEIAESLGAPLGTIKSRTRAALSKLRVYFETAGASS
jgi:RNA polymerase sigma-70 factor, ECF subfamily